MIGSRLAHYEITGHLGSGGMGEVYRARDTKLKREVAIKILPEQFSRDADRIFRFQREAEVLASLNHSNIAAIHEVSEAASSRFLVLELVEGETLADRLKQGAIPVDEALQIAKQIAEALEAAHGKGVVHRDLKPANVKLTPEGKVKVLDFGLAKMLEPETSPSDFSKSPTLMSGTIAGVIIGTAAYMSPEQARGQATDAQSDVWAFGCVLFEMLTGRQSFTGDTITDLLGGIVRVDPDWTALPKNTPPLIRLLLRQCLQKPRNTRLHHIGDARIQIDAASVDIAPAPVAVAAASGIWRRPVIWIVGALVLITIAAMTPYVIGYFRLASKEPSVVRFSVAAPEKAVFVPGLTSPYPSLSPDGTRLAFNALSDGISRVWIRSLDSLDARPLTGTEGVSNVPVFWSPDSRFIAFHAQGKLKKIEVAGGPAQTLCDATALGGTWNSNGLILFADAAGVIQRVSAAGGNPEPVTSLDASRQESRHVWPWFLPDGDHFLFLARGSTPESDAVMSGSLTSKETKVVINANSRVAFDRSGYLLFTRERSLMAQPFDARKLQTTGDAFPTAEQVRTNPLLGIPSWSISENGVFAYRTGGAAFATNNKLTWYDRSGKALNSVGPVARYSNPELSPDGKRVAVERGDSQSPNADIWIIDLSRDVSTRLTFDPADDRFPIWSPDGIQISFTRNAGEPSGAAMYLKPSSGAGAEEPILNGDASGRDWSADGKFVVYNSKNSTEVWTLPISGERKPVLYLAQSSFANSHGKLSPDGRWFLYQSNESGRNEIYVQSYPTPSAKWQISNAGGITPRWRKDGKEIFYLSPDQKLMAVPVRTAANSIEPSTPIPLFEVRLPGGGGQGSRQFDVTADGQRFLLNTFVDETAEPSITVVLNWLSGLRK